MNVLLTNDDGIDAPGIQLLEEIARQLSNDVWVIAPDSEKSGAGHSISLHNPFGSAGAASTAGRCLVRRPTACSWPVTN